MTRRRGRSPERIAKCLGALVLIAALATASTRILATKSHVRQGVVHFVGSANSAFDKYTRHRDPAIGAFLRRHMWRMIVYSPYFDGKTRWYPNGWVYDDAYAVYRGSPLSIRHPEWILRDGAGNPLYIPFACAHGTCPQYAADISNPAFRAAWIAGAKDRLKHGYRGLFIDDVNMEFRVSNGQQQHVAPIDRTTGEPMTYDAWRGYMAQFMDQIRAALAHTEIVHNAIWFADSPTRTADRHIRQEILAANYVNLERGVNDLASTGGELSLDSFLHYVDVVHSLGRGVLLDSHVTERAATEYSLAVYLLISSGNDGISTAGMTPTHWWSGFDVNLGDAVGPRRKWDGVLRRDFTGGMALVDEPGASSQTVRLPRTMLTLDGRKVSSVTLVPAGGVVLENA